MALCQLRVGAMSDCQDPNWVQQVLAIGYGVVIALWGGIVAHLGLKRRTGMLRHLLLADLATSGFVGFLTYHILLSVGVTNINMIVAASGVAGHMGARAIVIFERVMCDWVESRTGACPQKSEKSK